MMQVNAESLKDFYLQELDALRDEASEFSLDYPAQAQELGFHFGGRSQDPHVEMLLQSFSYLTARLRYRLEVDQAALPNALIADLYPHLEAPVPSMLIAEMDVKPGGANFVKGVSLDRGRQISTTLRGDAGLPRTCRFTTCSATPLWPLEITDISVVPPDTYGALAHDSATRSVLRLRIAKQGRDLIGQLNPSKLRFFINSEERFAYRLYDLLAVRLNGIAVSIPKSIPKSEPPSFSRLNSDALHWLGFSEDESALPSPTNAHPAYRLLQEYFSFPEKFLFFEVDLPNLSSAQESIDLLFLLDMPPDASMVLSPEAIKINCVPLVNLYHQRIDPLALDHSRYEYQLSGDIQNTDTCEIYRLEKIESIRPQGKPRPIVPYFGMDDFQSLEKQDYFYLTRREVRQTGRMGGTDLFISFLDKKFNLTQPVDEVIGGSALCTNRRLPERVRVGEPLTLEGAGPISAIRAASKVSSHQTPPLTGIRPWSLASQLTLNHLSIAEGEKALSALKEMLRLHVGGNLLGQRQIDALHKLSSRSLVRWLAHDGQRGYVPCLQLDLLFDDMNFDGASPVLFCEVLRRFFSLYAAVNTVVQVRLSLLNVKGIVKEWPPLVGVQALL